MKKKSLQLAALLFLFGMFISAYLIHHHYALINGEGGFSSFCSINQTIDCDAVNASQYSEIMGIPLASFAFGFYLASLILALIADKAKVTKKEAITTLFLFSSMSCIVSLFTFSISAFILQKICLMCSSLQAISIISFILILLNSDFIKNPLSLNRTHMTKMGLSYVILITITAAFASTLKNNIPFDEQSFLNDFQSQKQHPIEDLMIEGSPSKGFDGQGPAPLTLVEFADFQCPACAMAAKQMHRLTSLYKNKIRLVFKNFPLDSSCNPHVPRRVHDYACTSAKAAICAQKENKFFEFYELLFDNQHDLSIEKITTWAKNLHLDMNAFTKCMDSPDTLFQIQKDVDLGHKLELRSTPTFFVNGRKVEGVIDEAKLKLLIRELKL